MFQLQRAVTRTLRLPTSDWCAYIQAGYLVDNLMHVGVVSGTVPCPFKNYTDFYRSAAELAVIERSSNRNPEVGILEGEVRGRGLLHTWHLTLGLGTR